MLIPQISDKANPRLLRVFLILVGLLTVTSICLAGCNHAPTLLPVTETRIASSTPHASLTATSSSTPSPSVTPTLPPTATPTNTPTRYLTPTITQPAPASYTGPLPPGLVGRLGMGSLNQVAASPDGKLLAIASNAGIYIYNSAPFEQERLILTDDQVYSVAWSLDGRYLAGGVGDKVIIWEREKWSVLHNIATGRANKIKWSPRSEALATVINVGWGNDAVRVWNVDKEDLRYSIKYEKKSQFDDFNLDIDWSSTGKLAVTDTRGPIRVYRGDTGELIYQVEGSPYQSPVAWSPDGSILAICGPRKSIRFLNGNNGGEQQTIEVDGIAFITELAWSEDGRYLAVGNYNFLSVGVVDVQLGQLTDEFYGNTYYPNSLAWLDGDQTLVSLAGGLLVSWDRETHLPQHVIHTSGAFSNVVWSPDGKTVSASDGRRIVAWDISTGQLQLVINVTSDFFMDYSGVHDMALSPNGDRYAAIFGDDSRYLEIWDAKTGQRRDAYFQAEPGMAWSPDGKYIVTRNLINRKTAIWDSRTGGIVKEFGFVYGDYPPWGVDWSPDGSMIAGVNGKVYLVDYPSGNQWYLLQNCGNGVVTLMWSPDGEKLAAVSTDGSVRICDPKADRLLYQLKGIPQQAELPDLAWSPDGRLLAVSAYRYDTTIPD